MFEDEQFRDEPRNEWVTDPGDYEYARISLRITEL